MMHISQMTLDGVSNGIAAFIRSKNQWIKRTDGKGYLFPNFDTLEARLFREQDIEYHDIQFFFSLTETVTGIPTKIQISLNDAVKTDHGWKVSRWEKIFNQDFLHIYDITEVTSYQVTNIGYITSNKSGTHDPNKDPKYEYKKLKEFRNMVNEAIEKMAVYQQYGMSVRKNKFGIDIKLDNTTAHIHIWTNAKVMDYNTAITKIREQKDMDIRCLPFLKGQDKYGSMYLFITCEESDTLCNYTRTRSDQVSECLIAYLQDLNPSEEIQFTSCPYTGKILLSKEVDWYGDRT